MTIDAGRRIQAGRGLAISLLLFLLVVIVAAYLSIFAETYTDDAFIQIAYARNVARHGTWGLVPDRPANTATSPLNVLLAAAFDVVFESPLVATLWLTAAELTALCVFLVLISRRFFGGWFFGAFASVAYLTNPLLLSTLGLESTLYIAATVASMYFLIARRWHTLALTLAVLTLARPDGFLLFLICFALVSMPIGVRLSFALLYAAVLAPWHLYSWFALGSIVPDTLVIKTGQHAWREGMTFGSGLRMYLGVYPLATAVSFAALPLVIPGFGRPPAAARPVARVLIAYAVLHFIAYWLLEVPPYHWYYVHQMIPLVFIGSIGAAAIVAKMESSPSRLVRASGWAFVALPAIGLLAVVSTEEAPFTEAPIHTNWASHRQYREAGLWLKGHLDPSTVVTVDGEVGTLAFYSERRLVNEFSEPSIVSGWIRNKEHSSRPLIAALLRINRRWRRDRSVGQPSHALVYVPADRAGPPAGAREVVKSWPISSRWTRRAMRPMQLMLVRK